jgi:hypothetical protein
MEAVDVGISAILSFFYTHHGRALMKLLKE